MAAIFSRHRRRVPSLANKMKGDFAQVQTITFIVDLHFEYLFIGYLRSHFLDSLKN